MERLLLLRAPKLEDDLKNLDFISSILSWLKLGQFNQFSY